jgi:plasmid stabilization system protein ParE
LSQFRVSPAAQSDIEAIAAYISDDNHAAAEMLVEEFYRAFELLGQRPMIGHRRPDLTSLDVFFWPVRSYLIIYRREARHVGILAVLHGRRDLKKILSGI